MVTHVHGAHTTDESDGYAEAWYLPKAVDIPAGYATEGTWYNTFKAQFLAEHGETWEPGSATFEYPNQQRPATLWYHDHTLGMTRLNVYAGPAGFYLLRGGPLDDVRDSRTNKKAVLPGPAPTVGSSPFGTFFEIPIAIQDRSFKPDGQLFYPDNRAYFEGLDPSQLQIPFHPDMACDDMMSDVAPIWNPEFFGNAIVVNGRTWPFQNVQRRRYRLRMLNGCQARFLILDFSGIPGVQVHQIGAEGGFLPAPYDVTVAGNNRLLMCPAERADLIVDFTNVPEGDYVLGNLGPDEPFAGGVPDEDFEVANPATTGQVMQFRVGPIVGTDTTTPAQFLALPARTPLGAATVTRRVSLNEEESKTVRVITDENGNIVLACDDPAAMPFGPTAALLGTMEPDPLNPGQFISVPRKWTDPAGITENPAVGATEVWEIYNYTVDAHPMHLHEVMFEVVNRQSFDTATGLPTGAARLPEAWETGTKDTVIAYPGEVTRVKATFDLPGLYVWHCHIVEHEDNEMMRPLHRRADADACALRVRIRPAPCRRRPPEDKYDATCPAPFQVAGHVSEPNPADMSAAHHPRMTHTIRRLSGNPGAAGRPGRRRRRGGERRERCAAAPGHRDRGWRRQVSPARSSSTAGSRAAPASAGRNTRCSGCRWSWTPETSSIRARTSR